MVGCARQHYYSLQYCAQRVEIDSEGEKTNFRFLYQFDQFKTILDKFNQVWTSLNKFEHVWTSLDKVET